MSDKNKSIWDKVGEIILKSQDSAPTSVTGGNLNWGGDPAKYASEIQDRIKRLGYEISSNRNVSSVGRLTLSNIWSALPGILKGLTIKDPTKMPKEPDDNKWMYFFGNSGIKTPEHDNTGFDYSAYINQHHPNKNVKTYKGIIHPKDTLYFDISDKKYIDSLAKNNSHIYLNADDAYLDYLKMGANDTMNEDRIIGAQYLDTGYRDDVHNHIIKFRKQNNNDIVADASDLYDFTPDDYSKQFGGKWQAKLMDKYGTPYILRQNNIPVKFINVGEQLGQPPIYKNGKDYRRGMTDEQKIADNIHAILSDTFRQGDTLKLQRGNKITPEHARLLGRRGMPGDKEALAAAGYDSKGRPLFTFGGGSFGGAGVGATFGDGVEQIENYDYVRNTPILQSFSDAFNNARKAGLPSFTFNGKEYTTEISDNPNYIGKKYQPLLNIREVLDKNMKVMSDSTRIEPYVGQLPGVVKRKSSQ